MGARCGLAVAVALAACGGARVEGTMRVPTSSEAEALLVALRAAHGVDTRVLEARAIGSPPRVLAIYTAPGPLPAAAAMRMCGGAAVGEVGSDTCSGSYVGVARLGDDRAGLGGDLALGCNAERALPLQLDGGDLDGDGRAELSIEIGSSATFVIDVERFDTQLAAWVRGLVLEHPRGTGLVVPLCRPEGEYVGPRTSSEPPAEPPSESFDFVDLTEGCEASVVPYDPAFDCWRYGLRP